MVEKLILFIVKKLIPTEPKARKKFIRALFPGSHLHCDPYTVIPIYKGKVPFTDDWKNVK